MKVEIRNLGILRQAEFSLGKLTIICVRGLCTRVGDLLILIFVKDTKRFS